MTDTPVLLDNDSGSLEFKYIPFKYHEDFYEHNAYAIPACVMCGKKIRSNKFFIFDAYGGMAVDKETAHMLEETGDFIGMINVGPACRKALPAAFVFKRG